MPDLQACGIYDCKKWDQWARQCGMTAPNYLVPIIQALAAEEGTRQPTAADWLWNQDKDGRETVNVDDAVEMAFWANVLKVTPRVLASAIDAVGTNADSIRSNLTMTSRKAGR